MEYNTTPSIFSSHHPHEKSTRSGGGDVHPPPLRRSGVVMVMNSRLIATVANVSGHVCQYVACNPEILPSEEVLRLVLCFPFQGLRRLSLCLSAVFCCHSIHPFAPLWSSSSDDEDEGDGDGGSRSSGYHSHSD